MNAYEWFGTDLDFQLATRLVGGTHPDFIITNRTTLNLYEVYHPLVPGQIPTFFAFFQKLLANTFPYGNAVEPD